MKSSPLGDITSSMKSSPLQLSWAETCIIIWRSVMGAKYVVFNISLSKTCGFDSGDSYSWLMMVLS